MKFIIEGSTRYPGYTPWVYKCYPVSGVAFDLSRNIEGDSARRVYKYVHCTTKRDQCPDFGTPDLQCGIQIEDVS